MTAVDSPPPRSIPASFVRAGSREEGASWRERCAHVTDPGTCFAMESIGLPPAPPTITTSAILGTAAVPGARLHLDGPCVAPCVRMLRQQRFCTPLRTRRSVRRPLTDSPPPASPGSSLSMSLSSDPPQLVLPNLHPPCLTCCPNLALPGLKYDRRASKAQAAPLGRASLLSRSPASAAVSRAR